MLSGASLQLFLTFAFLPLVTLAAAIASMQFAAGRSDAG